MKVIHIAFAGFCAAATVAGCASIGPPAERMAHTENVAVWLTNPDQSALLAKQPEPTVSPAASASASILVDPSIRYQEMVGFGAAITDASAHLIQSSLNEEQRASFLAELFGPSPGLNMSFTRLVFGASDFSSTHYSYNDMPAGETDPQLSRFSISVAKEELLPTVREALEINPALTIMASPWSAPGWMKTTDSLVTGSLRDDSYTTFASYLRRSIEAFANEGVPIHYISVQNEPDFEPANYPGMRLSPAQRAKLIGEHLGPGLAAAGINTKILEWDHNWDQPEQPLSVLADEKAAPYISGVAWHCYGGDVSAQSQVREAHPEKDVFFTECSGGKWSEPWPDAWVWTMRNIIIGTSRNWSRGAILWNLALNEADGPHLGGCGNCRGVVTIDSGTGEIARNPEYFALAHVSRFVEAGASRIDSQSTQAGLESVAFLNKDGSRVLVVLNISKDPAGFSVNADESSFTYTLPPEAAATFVWNRQPIGE